MNSDYDHLRALFRHTPETMSILSGPNHVYECVNEAHIKAAGYDATGTNVRDLKHKVPELLTVLDQVYQTGTAAELHEIEVEIMGQFRYFNLTVSPRKDTEEKVIGIIMLGTEVTEQIAARKAQHDENSWLKLVLDYLPSPIFLIDPILNRVTFANKSGEKLFGIAIEGTLLHERYDKSNLQAFQNGRLLNADEVPSARAGRGEIFQNEEIMIRSPHGEFWMIASSNLLPASYGEKETALLVLQDVSSLQKSEERLSMAVGVSKIGFYDWDMKQDRVIFSDQMKEDWGLTGLSSHSNDFGMSFVHPEDRPRVEAEAQQAIAEYRLHHTQFRVNRPDGHMMWVELRGQVHYDEKGVPDRFFGTSVDITEQKMISEELNLAKIAAEDANAAKSAFLANMSHEIRTPLGAIMGFVELIKKKNLKQEELASYLSIIDRNSGQLLRIIDDILDLSKVEAGRMMIEKIDFNLSDLLSDVASLMSFKAKEKGIGFEIRAKTKLPEFVNTDPTRLRQILNNIVGNAIKFTDKGSIDLEVSYEDDQIDFIVSDTGVGMSPEQSEKLFQPFSQGDVSITRKFGGTGLGLVLTRKLCELLGGEFNLIRSVVNQGSSFRARIHAFTAPGAHLLETSRFEFSSKPMQSEIDLLPLNKIRVLVVDDSPDNRTLISITLSEMGAVVDLASDGLEAVEKALNGHYDVVLMDLQMPRMDGHEAVKSLIRAGFKVPVIALTAHAMREERDRCMASGFSGFLSKPLDRELLQKEIVSKVAHPHSILVIEDDIDLKDLMIFILSEYQQSVMWVKSAEDALAYLETHALPKLILLDLTLPQMSGEEFLNTIRSREDRKNTSVIVSSGWDHLEEKCRDFQADGFLKKPFDLNDISKLMARYFPK